MSYSQNSLSESRNTSNLQDSELKQSKIIFFYFNLMESSLESMLHSYLLTTLGRKQLKICMLIASLSDRSAFQIIPQRLNFFCKFQPSMKQQNLCQSQCQPTVIIHIILKILQFSTHNRIFPSGSSVKIGPIFKNTHNDYGKALIESYS